MPAPSILAVARHVLSRALRETGQALDRVGVRGAIHARQGRRMGNDDPYVFNDHLSRHRQVMGLPRRGEPIVPGLTVGAGGGGRAPKEGRGGSVATATASRRGGRMANGTILAFWAGGASPSSRRAPPS